MRILIAPDKFKGCLPARDVGAAIASGLRKVLPDVEIRIVPIADGGDGTVSVIAGCLPGEIIHCDVMDPLGRPVRAGYFWNAERREAIIEMSAASGLALVGESERDVLGSSTFGTGELMADSMRRGAETILVGLGGSATNDGGIGMAAALGFRFHDGAGALINPIAGNLLRIEHIVPPSEPITARVSGLSDVRNPLLGSKGCSRTFGPQKGATPPEIVFLETGLGRLAEIAARVFGCDHRQTPGAGAAGGLGFGLLAFCHADLRPGFDELAEMVKLRERIEEADLIITAEGRLDEQTLQGKGPFGVARMARSAGKPVIVFAGDIGTEDTLQGCFDVVIPIATGPISMQESIDQAADLLALAAARAARLLALPKTS